MTPANRVSARPFVLESERRFERPAPGVLRKCFAPEDQAAFDHELEMLSAARGPGVPAVLGHGTDEQRRRLWIDLEFAEGEDLQVRIGREGPLPLDEVLKVGRRLARILQRLHDEGLVHGDVKPANVLLGADGALVLVDFEHAVRCDDREGPSLGFTGGTHGYAPPEASLGRPRDPAFDRYAFGATLHALLTGFPPDAPSGSLESGLLQRLHPRAPKSLLLVLEALLDERPEHRPRLDAVAKILDEIVAPEPRAELDLLSGTGHAAPRVRAWRERLARVLRATLPQPASERPPDRGAVFSALRFFRAVHLALRFVPRMPELREALERALAGTPEWLERVVAEVKRLRGDLELDEALALAQLGVELCRVLASFCHASRELPTELAHLGRRLHNAAARLEAERARRDALLDEAARHEARFDLDGAERALRELVDSYSGATREGARLRDRHLRFVWLLERVAAEAPALETARETMSGAPPTPQLSEFLGRVREVVREATSAGGRSLARLERLLLELAELNSHLELATPLAELGELRRTMTRRIVELILRIERGLESDPVPLRPLLRDLVEIDRILLCDCVVDTEGLSRGRLYDRLERLRLRIEEVSEQYQRIARGARERIDQGRLTTALYDLQRALAARGDEADPSAGELRREVERARRLRDEIERMTRRNLELGDLYEKLVADRAPSSDRIRCLAQREEVLSFLLAHGPAAFAGRYEKELGRVRIQRAEEVAGDAEERLLSTGDPQIQARIAQEVLEALESSDLVPDARLEQLRRRWLTYQERADADLEARRRWRRRMRWIAGTTALVVLAAAAVLLGPRLFGG